MRIGRVSLSIFNVEMPTSVATGAAAARMTIDTPFCTKRSKTTIP
jgi:hypothetical protein